MAGRNRMSRHPDGFRGFRDGPRSIMNRGPGPRPLHPAALEEELEVRRREVQRIVAENHHVIQDNSILERELVTAKEEIHRLSQVIPKIQADKEARARELILKGLALEAELRAVEPTRTEVMHLKSDIQKLNALQRDLSAKVQSLRQDISLLEAENQKFGAMRTDIDGMHKELIDARRAFEYEKKANEEQVEQKQAMEKNLTSMARELEKLRAEQLNTDRRAWGLGDGSYGMLNGSPEMRNPGGGFGDDYGRTWRTYDRRGPRH